MLLIADVAPDAVPAWSWAILILSILVGVGILAWNIWAIVDCARRPDYQWAVAGQDKTTWLLLLILVGLVVGLGCGVTMILMPILYMAIPRPKLREAAQLPPPPGYAFGYGPPPTAPPGPPTTPPGPPTA
ncbi:MAG: DUF2516 family protein [Acidimicrobiia bacterium]|nr:DUF2516 family protein [Acidimicrobiia bacterium]